MHSAKNKYKCDDCGYSSNFKGNLNSHMNAVHTKIFKYKCSTCSLSYKTNSSLYVHIKKAHLGWKAPKRVYTCEICSKSFTTKVHMVRHLLIKIGLLVNIWAFACVYTRGRKPGSRVSKIPGLDLWKLAFAKFSVFHFQKI